jgi:hypothetical protein
LEELQNRLREKVLKFFGNVLSIVVYTPTEYKKMSGELKKGIEKGIVVVGG